MKFDTIIIGGGLSGLTAGIELSRKGQKCLIVSSGQSALHFFSGSFELYGMDADPFKAMESLSPQHPYSMIGMEKVRVLADGVKPFFKEMGIELKGEDGLNHWRVTPLGLTKPAWLTLDEYASIPSHGQIPWKKVAILNIDGFLDFHASYIAAGLEARGVETVVKGITMPELKKLRQNPTEMRSANISKTLVRDSINTLAARINEHVKDVDAVLMPAVVGLTGCSDVVRLKEMVDRPLHFIATLPPSVPGIRLQMMLKKHFQKVGGTYMLGDSVTGGGFANGRLNYITTQNHSDVRFEADNFIIATGSFFSKGLVSDINGVREPIFGLDVNSADERSDWYKRNFFEAQPYMNFGVATDSSFHAAINGAVVENLYAVGSVIGGCNSIKEGCGAGVAILSSLHVASLILNC
jgi:glycerol-3-phosphate dehydrogenase subunit B